MRAAFAVLAAAGVLAAGVVVFLPRLVGRERVMRFRAGRWLSEHAHCTHECGPRWLLVFVSWSLRGIAVLLLLDALSLHGSFPLALAFLCASAASAALPIAPAGAATQAGAGAAILALSGIGASEAVAFSVAAQALVIVTGAAVVLLVASAHVARRFRPRPVRPAAPTLG